MPLIQKVKRGFWSMLYPLFPYIEHSFLFIHKRKRQRYHIGWLAPEKTLSEMKNHLSTKYGFGNHFIAWEDPDQILSWRRLDGFDYQYHLRVFADGELRGHYESTPESTPVSHFFEQGERPRTKDFLSFLGPFVTKHKYVQSPLLKRKIEHAPEVTFLPRLNLK